MHASTVLTLIYARTLKYTIAKKFITYIVPFIIFEKGYMALSLFLHEIRNKFGIACWRINSTSSPSSVMEDIVTWKERQLGVEESK